jgi:hypothetical protein
MAPELASALARTVAASSFCSAMGSPSMLALAVWGKLLLPLRGLSTLPSLVSLPAPALCGGTGDGVARCMVVAWPTKLPLR